jgi:hypothetical protein
MINIEDKLELGVQIEVKKAHLFNLSTSNSAKEGDILTLIMIDTSAVPYVFISDSDWDWYSLGELNAAFRAEAFVFVEKEKEEELISCLGKNLRFLEGHWLTSWLSSNVLKCVEENTKAIRLKSELGTYWILRKEIQRALIKGTISLEDASVTISES